MVICLSYQIMPVEKQSILFEQGKNLFLQGHYQQAFDVYDKIQDKNFVVLYNMAIISLRLHKKSQVVLLAKRAEKQARTYKEFTLIEELLEFDENDEDYDSSHDSWYEQLLKFCKKITLIIPMIFVQLLVILGLLSLIIGWYYRWYIHRKKASILIILVWLFFYCISLYKINFMQQKYGVVLKNSIILAGPDTLFYKKSDVNESMLVYIVDHSHQYYKIISNGVVGWVDSCNIELV